MGEDRISNLTDELILFIISFLPIDSAIRTGILSKRWLHLWKFLKVIHFPPLPGGETKRDYGSIDQCIGSLAPLELGHQIDKFIIEGRFETPCSYYQSSFHSWVEFAVARRVSCLELYMMVDNEVYYPLSPDDMRNCFRLPDSFYHQNDEYSMEIIALSCVKFDPRPRSNLGNFGFSNLKRLFLFDSELVDEGITSTISGCKLLESVSIVKCFGFRCLYISSAFLKEFEFIVRDGDNPMRFEIDAPNLKTIVCFGLVMWIFEFNNNCYPVQVAIFEPLRGDDPYYGNPRLLIDQLSQAKYFAFNDALMPVLTKYVKDGPHTTFNNLKEIYFAGYYFSKEFIASFFTFIGQCPSLNKLKIEFDHLDLAYDGTLKMLPTRNEDFTPPIVPNKNQHGYEWNDDEEGEILKAVSLEELKSIELFHYWSSKDLFELVRHLCQRAINLESIMLSFSSPEHLVMKRDPEWVWPLDLKERVIEEISLLPKASSHAKVFIR